MSTFVSDGVQKTTLYRLQLLQLQSYIVPGSVHEHEPSVQAERWRLMGDVPCSHRQDPGMGDVRARVCG